VAVARSREEVAWTSLAGERSERLNGSLFQAFEEVALAAIFERMTPQPQENWKSLYPFRAHEIHLDSCRYHYIDEGAGEPLLMVHGNPTWSFYYRNLILGLRDRYRVIAPDHIGCGGSEKPARYPYTLAQHTSNLVELVRRLDLRGVTLVAHDWGGAIGLGAALRERSRFRRVVLFNTGAFPPPYVPFRIRLCRLPLFGTLAICGFNAFARAALFMAVEKPERMTPSVRAGLLAPYNNWSNRVAIDRFVRDIPFTRRHPTWQTLANLEAGLSDLRDRPVLLIWGMQDWCFNETCLHRLQALFPQAEVHPLADAGHYVVEDAYERIIPLIESFLERTAAR
jgi:pimeloyl-ACP methyl ester carboxylesterase